MAFVYKKCNAKKKKKKKRAMTTAKKYVLLGYKMKIVI